MKKSILLVAFILLHIMVSSAVGQQMNNMPGMNMQPQSKMVYLLMMDTMMVAMDNVPHSTSTTGTFMQEMIPHHQGAIQMAKYEIEHGKNFEMIQLAKSIMAEQNSEISQMELWLKQEPDNNELLPQEFTQAMDETMTVMMKDMPNSDKLTDNDLAFARVMIPHHQAAIDMAKVLLKYSNEQPVTTYAKQLISAEKIEIEQMQTFINQTPNEN